MNSNMALTTHGNNIKLKRFGISACVVPMLSGMATLDASHDRCPGNKFIQNGHLGV